MWKRFVELYFLIMTHFEEQINEFRWILNATQVKFEEENWE